MDIQRAKEEIKRAVQAYLATDDIGRPLIPAVRQRPILLMGPPGVGKTQIMEQIAQECDIALVAYTITHHTRQSAVGLPFIREHDAAIFAVQDLRQPGCAGRLGHRGRGQSAGVQQECAGV